MSTILPAERQRARARFGLLLGSVSRKWRRALDGTFRELGLSDATHAPLLALYVHEQPLRQKDLADALSVDTSSLVRVLAYLREAGLVDCTADAVDGRTKRIGLTAGGRKVAAQILARSLQIEDSILSDLSDHEITVTRRALEKISRRFDTLDR